MTERELRDALREGLSGCSFPRGRQENVLRQLRGEEKMTRKLSVGLVLLLVLALAAVTALAVTVSRQYFADLAQLQFESGYYDDWSLKEKETMVDIMRDNSMMDDDTASALKAGGESAIDEYMIGRYGINGRSDVIGLYAILDKELGAIDTWSMEQKAWYSQLLKEHGLLGSDEEIYLMPGDEAIAPEEAIAIARAAIEEAWELPDNALAGYESAWEYMTFADDADGSMTHYSITFRNGDSADGSYHCSVSPTGHVLSSADNAIFGSPAEQRQWQRENEEADLHWRDTEVEAILAEYAQAHGLGESYMFRTWSIEDQYAVTELMRPVILQHMADDPLYSNELNIYLATHFYGLPDEQSMPQQEAETAAIAQVAQELSVPETLLEVPFLHYDMTDPAQPPWKVTVRGNDAGSEDGIHSTWLVCINARTREITRTEKHYFGPGSTQNMIEMQY